MASSSLPGTAELNVKGSYYGGWKTLRVSRSIEQLAGTYDLTVTERWPGQPAATPIRPGQFGRLFMDEQIVVTGYIDTVMPDYDANHHAIRVSGRDKTADLIDCSAVYKSGQWKNAKLDRLASDLLKPYDIKVVVEADVGKAFSSFNIQEGESIFECLDRAARMRALLLTSNPDGDLVITRAGNKRLDVVLEEGVNIKAARGEFSWKDRYSSYTAKGQGKLGADGDQAHASPTAKVTDSVITRHRPLIVLADSHSENASLRDRAEWERNVRRGRGVRGSITVQGWCDPTGALWQPNTLVTVHSPWLWLDQAVMLIVGCTWSLDERGTNTELAIARPDAFQLLEGVTQSRLYGKLKTKEEREKREKYDDWSPL